MQKNYLRYLPCKYKDIQKEHCKAMRTSTWQIQVFFKVKIEEGQTQRVTCGQIMQVCKPRHRRSLAGIQGTAIQRINTVLMTEGESGQSNCILGLSADVGTNTWYESHIFQAVHRPFTLMPVPRRILIFMKRLPLIKVSMGPQKKVEFTLIRNECESTRKQIFLSSTSRIQINKWYKKTVITPRQKLKKSKEAKMILSEVLQLSCPLTESSSMLQLSPHLFSGFPEKCLLSQNIQSQTIIKWLLFAQQWFNTQHMLKNHDK